MWNTKKEKKYSVLPEEQFYKLELNILSKIQLIKKVLIGLKILYGFLSEIQ